MDDASRMITELESARELLDSALNRYLGACADIRNYCMPGSATTSHVFDQQQIDKLTACAINEIPSFTSRYAKLGESKAAMSTIRNSSPAVVHINILPSEVLSHIFDLVLGAQIYDRDKSRWRGPFIFPAYPDTLSHVCYHWRRVAISTRRLWSYIDFALHYPINKQLTARAEEYVTRTGDTSLHIRIAAASAQQTTEFLDNAEDLLRFLSSVAPRIGSLHMEAYFSLSSIYTSILRGCFTGATPGRLSRMVLVDVSAEKSTREDNWFIESNEDPTDPKSILVDVTKQNLEDLWFPITTLRLRGLCPGWDSKAYHGLVYLQLRHSTALPKITEAQLVKILSASPGLRFLYFSLPIIAQSPTDSSVISVHLGDLEVLNLAWMDYQQLGALMRLITPGSRLSQVSFSLTHDVSVQVDDHVKNFFAGVQVTRLAVYEMDSIMWIPEIIPLVPHLEILVLGEGVFPSWRDSNLPEEQGPPAVQHAIDHLYLLRSTMRFSRIQWLLNQYPARSLTSWRSRITTETGCLCEYDDLVALLPQDGVALRVLNRPSPNPLLTIGWFDF